ncbi:MAG: hypothetical protein WBW32_12085 [Luteibacter sp.]
MTIQITDQFVTSELAARAAKVGRTPESEALYILQCVLHSVGMTTSCPRCAGGFADGEDNTWLMELWDSWSFVDELPPSEVSKKIAEKHAFFDTLFRGGEQV